MVAKTCYEKIPIITERTFQLLLRTVLIVAESSLKLLQKALSA